MRWLLQQTLMLSLKFIVLNSKQLVILKCKYNTLLLNQLFISINISFKFH